MAWGGRLCSNAPSTNRPHLWRGMAAGGGGREPPSAQCRPRRPLAYGFAMIARPAWVLWVGPQNLAVGVLTGATARPVGFVTNVCVRNAAPRESACWQHLARAERAARGRSGVAPAGLSDQGGVHHLGFSPGGVDRAAEGFRFAIGLAPPWSTWSGAPSAAARERTLHRDRRRCSSAFHLPPTASVGPWLRSRGLVRPTPAWPSPAVGARMYPHAAQPVRRLPPGSAAPLVSTSSFPAGALPHGGAATP